MTVAWELESDPDLRDAVKDVSTFTRYGKMRVVPHF
jgi:hypothetical protein